MRKAPIKTATVVLKDDYEGWQFTARINPPINAFGNIASGNFDRMIKGLGAIIIDWNFVDENGAPLDQPSDLTVGGLSLDLVTMLANEYIAEVNRVPKA
jgi:hypothetical protein